MSENTFNIADFDKQMKATETKDTDTPEIVKISVNMYVDDWLDLVKYRTYKILEQHNLDYSMADTFKYGFSLLEAKYNIKRGREKTTLLKGRKGTNSLPIKATSLNLSSDIVSFINDFTYHKVWIEKQVQYSRLEMYQEMVKMIKENDKEPFKS
jgi:hypothetical protein